MKVDKKDLEKFLKKLIRHKSDVIRLMHKLTDKMNKKATRHDNSKMSYKELTGMIELAKASDEAEGMKFGDKTYKKLTKNNEAIEAHREKNDHHIEYHENGIRDMNLVNVAEMVCDWISASKRKDGVVVNMDMLQKKYKFSDDLRAILQNTVDLLQK